MFPTGKTALDCVVEITSTNLANSVTMLFRQVGIRDGGLAC